MAFRRELPGLSAVPGMRGWSLGVSVALALGFSLLGGPGIQQTLTLSPEGFASLELTVLWIGEPLSASLGGEWDDTGLVRGELGGSLRAEPLELQAGLGLETSGTWEVNVGAGFSRSPISLLGNLSFGSVGVTGWSVGGLLELEKVTLQVAVKWEGVLTSGFAGYVSLEPVSLEVGLSFSDGDLSQVRGKVRVSGKPGLVGFGARYSFPAKEFLLSTEFDLQGEHISLGFEAVWNPFPGSTRPQAAHPMSPAPGGILGFLRELRIEASVITPAREGTGPRRGQGEPMALISSPKTSTFTVGEMIPFSARGSQVPGGPPLEFFWDFGDGDRARGVEVQHSYTYPGVYRVVLLVRDASGRTARAERVLRILAPELTADFAWDPEEPTVLHHIRFLDLSEGEVVAWHWDFGDGETSSEHEPVHRYSHKGTFYVSLTVTDAYGNRASVTKALTVVNIPPIADPGGPYQGVVYQEVLFSAARSRDPDGKIVEYIWDFGDGTTARGETVAHSYLKPGTYEVCLTVVDDDGAEAKACTIADVIYYPQIGGGP